MGPASSESTTPVVIDIRNKLWLLFESPIAWGGIGVLVGAIAATAYDYLFLAAWIILSVSLVRIKFFHCRPRYKALVGNCLLSGGTALLLAALWYMIPRPKEPATLDQVVDVTTGANSFCYFIAVPNAGTGHPISYPLTLSVNGRYPMRNAVSTIQTVIDGNNRESAMRQLQSMQNLPIGDGTLLPGVHPINFRLPHGRYIITTWSAAGGPINEAIDLRVNNGELVQNVEVWYGGKQRYKIGHEDLGFPK